MYAPHACGSAVAPSAVVARRERRPVAPRLMRSRRGRESGKRNRRPGRAKVGDGEVSSDAELETLAVLQLRGQGTRATLYASLILSKANDARGIS